MPFYTLNIPINSLSVCRQEGLPCCWSTRCKAEKLVDTCSSWI